MDTYLHALLEFGSPECIFGEGNEILKNNYLYIHIEYIAILIYINILI